MGSQEFCLKWNNHQGNLIDVFDDLLKSEEFVDVTLACQGLTLKVHKMVLSACSSFFKEIFRGNPCQHPIVFMSDVNFSDLQAIVEFMYKGEVNVSQDQLPSLLKTAEALQVKGLAEVSADKNPEFDTKDAPSPKRKRQSSESSQKPNANNPKQVKEERKVPKSERPREYNNGNVNTQNACQESEVAGHPIQMPTTSIESPDQTNNTKSPHSSNENSSEQDLSSVDPNQFLVQHFSFSDIGMPIKQEGNNNPCSSTASQSVFPSNQSHENLTSHASSSTFASNVPFKDAQNIGQQQLPSSANFSAKTLQLQNAINLNAVGITMPDLPFNQEGPPPSEKHWRARGRPASWSHETLQIAMTAVIKNGWSVTAAARNFGIPQPTLHSYISKFYKRNLQSMNTNTHGAPQVSSAITKLSAIANQHSLSASDIRPEMTVSAIPVQLNLLPQSPTSPLTDCKDAIVSNNDKTNQ